MIYTHIPYSLERNYGKAVNDFMVKLDDTDWAVIMDYDAMFTHNKWFHVVHEAIKEGDALITCPTNRTGNPYQKAKVDENNHNMEYHYKIGKELYEKHGNEVKDFECPGYLMSGYTMIFPKTLWSAIGGFPQGQYGVDNAVHRKAMEEGFPIKILPGVYVYHAYFRLK